MQAKRAAYASANVRAMVLDSTQLAEAEPNLRAGLAGGLLIPEDAVVYPPAAANFLREAEKYGATFLRGYSIVSAGRGRVQSANGTTITCGNIVAAIGADTSLLPWLPIRKRKGHLLITDRYPGFVRHQLVELGYLKSAHSLEADSVAFNIQPRQTGQLLIGSSRQFDNGNLAVDQAILVEMLWRASGYMPGILQASGIRVWTGFRAATPDNLPRIGPADDPTLVLVVGFEGLGITNAPGSSPACSRSSP